MDSHKEAHDGYVLPRVLAEAGEAEWPDESEGCDLLIELTHSDKIVIMQRNFGVALDEVEECPLVMPLSGTQAMDKAVKAMASLLSEVSRMVIVADEEMLEHWVGLFQQLAVRTNADVTLVSNILAINKDLVVSAVRNLKPDASVLVYKAGQRSTVTGADLIKKVDSSEAGYMLYALLAVPDPGYLLWPAILY
jgi:hypothetical protein